MSPLPGRTSKIFKNFCRIYCDTIDSGTKLQKIALTFEVYMKNSPEKVHRGQFWNVHDLKISVKMIDKGLTSEIIFTVKAVNFVDPIF